MKMADRIIFLGSGGSRVVVATQVAATGGFIIQIGSHQIWVDPGPGALVRAKECKVRASDTNIIFCSHHHIDHSNDINAVIDAMTIGGIRQKGILISTKTTIEGADDNGPILLNFYKKSLKETYPLTAGDKVTIGDLTFIATPTSHDCDAIGLRLETPHGAIGFTSDSAYTPELAEAFKGCTILIADVLRPGKEKWKTHMNSSNVAELFKEARPRVGIITAFGMKLLKANPAWEARDIQKESGTVVYAAKEGLRIDLKTLMVS
jgi:ribonuclease BN (tRNA processing enzyme)